MMNKQIGWSQESILLHAVSKQLERLAGILATSGGGGGGAVSSLTTTGTSGPATIVSGVLNIPDYTTTANNGLTKTGSNIQLGGPLIKHTDIDASGAFDFSIGQTTPPRSIFLKGGTSTSFGFTYLRSADNRFQYFDSGGLKGSVFLDSTGVNITAGFNAGNSDTILNLGINTLGSTYFRDNRTGANQSGIEYFADYSANFRPLSLIHKGYADATYVTPASTNTLTNKAIAKRVVPFSAASGTITPNINTTDILKTNSVPLYLVAPVTFAVPTGTKVEDQMLLMHFRDDGVVPRNLTFILTAGGYVGTVEFPLPSVTALGKWMKLLFQWNIALDRWELVSQINSL